MNQDIQENPSVESESFTKRNPPLNSEPHSLINLQGGKESNTVIESESRYLRKLN